MRVNFLLPFLAGPVLLTPVDWDVFSVLNAPIRRLPGAIDFPARLLVLPAVWAFFISPRPCLYFPAAAF